MGAKYVEARSYPRRKMNLVATIVPGNTLCKIVDISHDGAQLALFVDAAAISEEFILLLRKDGSVRRRCRLVWRQKNYIGVRFSRADAKAA